MGAGSHAGRARHGQGHRPASAATLGLKYPNRAQPHPLIILRIIKIVWERGEFHNASPDGCEACNFRLDVVVMVFSPGGSSREEVRG